MRKCKHGMTKHPLHKVWIAMRQRCRNPKDARYAGYGGRGIRVCPRWDDFLTFLADMGPRPEGMSLDRINNDGDYEPGNCRWATPKEQMRNTTRSALVAFAGRTLTVAEWSEVTGLSQSALQYRLNRGWSVDLALTLPATRKNSVFR